MLKQQTQTLQTAIGVASYAVQLEALEKYVLFTVLTAVLARVSWGCGCYMDVCVGLRLLYVHCVRPCRYIGYWDQYVLYSQRWTLFIHILDFTLHLLLVWYATCLIVMYTVALSMRHPSLNIWTCEICGSANSAQIKQKLPLTSSVKCFCPTYTKM